MNKFTHVMATALFMTQISATALAQEIKVPVKVETVQQAPLTTNVKVHGTVFGHNDVDLTAGAAGQLIYVAEPGQFVEKGEAVAQIDRLPVQLQHAEQEALIRRAELNVKFQQKELSRLMSLARTDAAAQSQIDSTQNQLDMAKSDIELAKIRLQQLADRLDRTTVRAPFDGVVSSRYQLSGREVSRAEPLVRFLDIDNLEVQLYVPIKYLPFVSLGQEMSIASDEFTHVQQSQALISAVIPATDARSQTFEIRAKIDLDNQTKWASGQLVDVVLPVTKREEVTLINRDALIIRRDGTHVVKIDSENKAHHIPVRVGKGEGQWVEVSPAEEGKLLEAGDKIAVRGAERLSEGQEVTIQSVS
ncbi:efflux RND transporter periplasmic adaptor subunit [Alteromonas facilis]|uniref:efflux RND transporter periplasmic adaptor subunit n=1 Tax=Alteromonas facilis TaxID=2048004 RepID=UPI000C292BA8|nr:efflux RND transporter periplasmic adaptor subunit [Alteromonas facilis]